MRKKRRRRRTRRRRRRKSRNIDSGRTVRPRRHKSEKRAYRQSINRNKKKEREIERANQTVDCSSQCLSFSLIYFGLFSIAMFYFFTATGSSRTRTKTLPRPPLYLCERKEKRVKMSEILRQVVSFLLLFFYSFTLSFFSRSWKKEGDARGRKNQREGK